MEKIRKHIITKIGAFILSLSILLTSCGKEKDFLITESKNNFSGQDYFNAIYFKKGELSSKIYKDNLNLLIDKEYNSAILRSSLYSFMGTIADMVFPYVSVTKVVFVAIIILIFSWIFSYFSS